MSGPPPFSSYRPPAMPGMPPMMAPRPYGFIPPPPMGMMPPRPGFMPGGLPPMPGPYGMPPPRPMMPPARVGKATTVYVGKIAASVEERVIQQLLEACGSIKSWKLMKDPDSNAHKGFGFCDFHDAEGVLRAVRLLNGMSLDGQELLIKPNSATDSYLEQYQRDKEQRAMERAEARVLKAIRQEDERKRAQQEQEQQQQQQAKQEQQAPEPMAVDDVKQEEGQPPVLAVNGAQEPSGSAANVKHDDGAAAAPSSNGDAGSKQEVKEESTPVSSTAALPQLQPPPKPKPLLPLDDEVEEGEDPLAAEKAADEKALAAIHAIVKPRDAARAANADAANEVLAAAGLVLPSPPPQGPSPGPYVDGAVASVSARGQSAERGKGRERSRDRSSGRDGRDSRHGSRGRSRREGDADAPAEVAERKLADAFDADRERAKREEEAKKRADDVRYERKLRELESRERQLVRERERDKDRQRDAAKERERHMRADLEAAESDDEVEPWQRRPIRHSRRGEERRKRRVWEERDDAADRAKDEAAAREAARQQAEEGQQQQQEEQEGDERSSKRARVEGQPAGTPPPQQEEGAQRAAAFNSAPHVPDDDPIYRAMVAAAQQPASQPSPAADLQPSAPSQQQQAAQQPQPRGSRLASAGGRPKKAVLALFGDEEEGEQKRRKLVPIQYTEEELRAVQEPEPATAQEASAAPTAPAAAAEDAKAVLRRIMDAIPVSREGVHEYPLKWETWDAPGTAAAGAAGESVRAKVSKWVSKKVADLLGAEEPDLVAFIMSLLDSRSTPQKVEDEVSAILDNEAASFTLKLYRLLIYETEKAALHL